MTREQKQEFTLRISRANPTEMVAILYKMLECYVQDAGAALEKEDGTDFRESLRRAKNCLGELMNSLDMRYEPAPALLSLCGYCIRRLTSAELRDRSARMDYRNRSCTFHRNRRFYHRQKRKA